MQRGKRTRNNPAMQILNKSADSLNSCLDQKDKTKKRELKAKNKEVDNDDEQKINIEEKKVEVKVKASHGVLLDPYIQDQYMYQIAKYKGKILN